MSWREVVISNSAKLDYQMGYMVVRGAETTKIHINEIGTVVVECTAVSLTSYLLSELIKHKVKVIFCDEKRNPSSELLPYYGSHDTSIKVKKQCGWTKDVKDVIWTEIVAEKIRQQATFLRELKKSESEMLYSYIPQIEIGDVTNREGHAAKVYFNALFGKEFTRTEESPTNAALNYGYAIILSAFNREIAANGYITQIGLFHDNMFNQFNLGSDLMETYRIVVDRLVYKMCPNKFEVPEKRELVDIINHEVFIDGRREFVSNAIKLYSRSVFDAINENDSSLIKHYRYEL